MTKNSKTPAQDLNKAFIDALFKPDAAQKLAGQEAVRFLRDQLNKQSLLGSVLPPLMETQCDLPTDRLMIQDVAAARWNKKHNHNDTDNDNDNDNE